MSGRRERRWGVAAIVGVALLLAGALVAGSAGAKASHAGWPKINGRLIIDKGLAGSHRTLRGAANRHNELLGGYGNDTIYGGNVGDVLWADFHPSGQPTSQVTHIYAGNGKNFIYASHGENFIVTGSGPSVVHAINGHGQIHCGSAAVSVFLSRHDRGGWRLTGCRHVHV